MSQLFLALTLALALGGLRLFAGAASSTDVGNIWDPNGQPTTNVGGHWDPNGQPTADVGSRWDPNG
jgi:hypothetical protein